jgi:hypothetical protein
MTRVTYLECMSILFRPASPPSLIIPFTPGTEEGPPPHTLGFITLITTQIFIAYNKYQFLCQQQLEVASAPACFESQPWRTLWGRLAKPNDDSSLQYNNAFPVKITRINKQNNNNVSLIKFLKKQYTISTGVNVKTKSGPNILRNFPFR